jgi:tetratricopeptide (TPR) repeat protein
VQGLPSAGSQRLNAALARIARDPRDYAALIDAGDAASAMGDPEAANGFYKRADGISPNNARTKAGMARALVLQGKPTEAIPLFAEAEAGGAAADVTSDRGLAYDLVGDPLTAQRYYQAALARRDEDEVRRRLGISLAITGDATGSNAMLMPLLRKQDKPAWRAHAFALAIAGKTKEAVDTVNAILPPMLAQSVTPYLRYMPRLTRAQQAAAVNLGKFPRASEIGRDDPAIAAYAPAAAPRVASADTRLIPRGKPLGGGSRSRAGSDVTVATAAPLSSSERRARDKAARLARVEAVEAARVAPPDPTPTIGRDSSGELPALATSTPMTPAATMAAAPAPRTAPVEVRSVQTLAARDTAAAVPTAPVAAPSQAVAVTRPGGPAVVRTGTLTLPSVETAQPSATLAAAPSASPSVPRVVLPQTVPVSPPPRSFDLAALATSTRPATASAPASPATSAASSTPAAAEKAASAGPASGAVSLEQVFADLGSPSRAPAPIAGAVDVRAIEPAPPAPVAELAKAEPPKTEPTRATARLGASKPSIKESETASTAERDALAVSKKKGVTSKDGKLAAAKLADAKLTDAKLADAKKADAKKADAKKKPDIKKPTHPSRIWVQVGVGRDKAAIGYDWRKFAKDNPLLFKGRQPYTSDMGRTNRILAGPFESQKAAVDLLSKLKKADIGGAFVWTSPAGQVVDPLSVD